LEKGFGAPYGLALSPTDKARPLNIKCRKSGSYKILALCNVNILETKEHEKVVYVVKKFT